MGFGKIAVAAIAGVSIGLCAPAASAQEWTPKAMGSRAGLDFDLWPTEETKTLVWAFVGQFAVVENVMIDVEIPWAATTGDRQSAFAFGNPTAGAHYGTLLTPNIGFFAGGTLSFPTTLDITDSDLETLSTKLLAAYSRAFFDVHRFVPEYLVLRPRVGIEIRAAEVFYYRGDLTPAIGFPIGTFFEDVESIIEQGNEFEGRASIGVGGGARFQIALPITFGDEFVFSDSDSDLIQTALEPFFSYEPPDAGFFARVGLLVALDEIAGFGFDEGKVATLRVQLGGKW